MFGTRQFAAIAMVAVMVLAGGCAGWGTDGPADGGEEDDDAGDLEETDGEAQADEGDSGDETDGAGADESDADDSTTSDDEISDSDDTDASKTGSDQDEKTDDSDSSDSDGEQDPQDETHTLRVGLIDATAAGPIAGTVTVDGETKEATPDEPAEFELDDGTYTVSGEYEEGWHVQSEEIEIDGEDVETNLAVVPIRTLTVETGEPDVDVTVERDDGETLSGTTGEDGTVTFETIPGSHTIDADGYERTQFVVPADFDPDPVVLEPTEDDDGETHTLTVTVTDPDGEPVTDETVHIVTYDGGADVASGTTDDDDGTVQFDLENGDYEVAVSAPDQDLYQPSDQRLVTIDGEDEEFSVQLESSGSDGDESDTATGIVRVVDQDGEPVEGEPVILSPPGTVEDEAKEERETNADGEVVIELAAGDPSDAVMYGVEVRDQEETLGIMSDDHHGVQEVTFNVGIDPGEPNYTATGKVIVFAGDDRVEGEPVTIEYEDGSTDEFGTDENDEVTLEFPKDAPDEITTVHAHVRDQTKSMIIETDENHGVQELIFQLEPQMTQFETTIVVENEQGQPIEGEVVEAQATQGDEAVEWEEIGTTDENGEVVLTGRSSDPTDVIQFEVRVQGYDQEPLQTYVDDSEHEETIVIESQPRDDPETHTLTVNLATHDVDGVAVTLEKETLPEDDEFEPVTKASAGGQVSFQVEEGSYYVDAEGYNPMLVGVYIDEDTEITIQETNPDPIEVTVVDADTDEGIEGAEISGRCDLWHSTGDSYIEGMTDETGVAHAETGVSPTSCNVTVEADDYEDEYLRLSVPDDDWITVELTTEAQDNETEQAALATAV